VVSLFCQSAPLPGMRSEICCCSSCISLVLANLSRCFFSMSFSRLLRYTVPSTITGPVLCETVVYSLDFLVWLKLCLFSFTFEVLRRCLATTSSYCDPIDIIVELNPFDVIERQASLMAVGENCVKPVIVEGWVSALPIESAGVSLKT